MFAVYGRSGQLFSGSLEALGQVLATTPLARSRRVVYSEIEHPPQADVQPSDRPHQEAVSAYTQALKPPIHRHPLTRVVDLMSRNVVTVLETTNAAQAWQNLIDQGVGQAPVLDGQGRLVGMLLRADLMQPDRLPDAHAHALAWKAVLLQPVEQVMVTPVPAVHPETDIRRLARVLLDTGLPGLPVTEEDGRLVGFVSRADILRAVVTDPPLDMWG